MRIDWTLEMNAANPEAEINQANADFSSEPWEEPRAEVNVGGRRWHSLGNHSRGFRGLPFGQPPLRIIGSGSDSIPPIPRGGMS